MSARTTQRASAGRVARAAMRDRGGLLGRGQSERTARASARGENDEASERSEPTTLILIFEGARTRATLLPRTRLDADFSVGCASSASDRPSGAQPPRPTAGPLPIHAPVDLSLRVRFRFFFGFFFVRIIFLVIVIIIFFRLLARGRRGDGDLRTLKNVPGFRRLFVRREQLFKLIIYSFRNLLISCQKDRSLVFLIARFEKRIRFANEWFQNTPSTPDILWNYRKT